MHATAAVATALASLRMGPALGPLAARSLATRAAVLAGAGAKKTSAATDKPGAAASADQKLAFFFDDDDAVIAKRKRDHIDICLKKRVEPVQCSFDAYRLAYKTLPEIDLGKVDLRTKLLNWDIAMPFVVSSLMAGEEHGRTINSNIAIACNRERVPFGMASMRIILSNAKATESFAVKHLAPDVPMFANIGLVQLNYGVGAKELAKIVDGVGADGLFVHVNALQEAVQPEGDTNFAGLLHKLESLMHSIRVPVIVKEIGHGVDGATARRLAEMGVRAIDISGVGGTSWAWVEGHRAPDAESEHNLGYVTRDLGLLTADSLSACLAATAGRNVQLIAGGGIRNGVQVAKALAMGAHLATASKPFLAAALDSADAVQAILVRLKRELAVAMFSCGAASVDQMRKVGVAKDTAVHTTSRE